MKNIHAVKLGSLGGKARAKKMSKKQRIAHAKLMVQARIRKNHERQ